MQAGLKPKSTSIAEGAQDTFKPKVSYQTVAEALKPCLLLREGKSPKILFHVPPIVGAQARYGTSMWYRVVMIDQARADEAEH